MIARFRQGKIHGIVSWKDINTLVVVRGTDHTSTDFNGKPDARQDIIHLEPIEDEK